MDPSQWRDYYSDLGVRPTATSQEIGRAFRALARTTHPDKKAPGDRSDSSEFRKIREAFEFLKDSAKRRGYDETYRDSKRSYDRHRQWQEAEAQRQTEAEARQESDEEDQRREEAKQRREEKRQQREEARKQARRERTKRRRAARREAKKEQRETEQREARRREQQSINDRRRNQQKKAKAQRQEDQARFDALQQEAVRLAEARLEQDRQETQQRAREDAWATYLTAEKDRLALIAEQQRAEAIRIQEEEKAAATKKQEEENRQAHWKAEQQKREDQQREEEQKREAFRKVAQKNRQLRDAEMKKRWGQLRHEELKAAHEEAKFWKENSARERHRLRHLETKERSEKIAKMVRLERDRALEVHLDERTLAEMLYGEHGRLKCGHAWFGWTRKAGGSRCGSCRGKTMMAYFECPMCGIELCTQCKLGLGKTKAANSLEYAWFSKE